jgi:hypothetical protein
MTAQISNLIEGLAIAQCDPRTNANRESLAIWGIPNRPELGASQFACLRNGFGAIQHNCLIA